MPISSPVTTSNSILSALHAHASPNSSSTPPPSSTPTPSSSKVWYLLSAIVCHYGGHAFGHYVAFRRKPRPPHTPSSSSSPSSYQRFHPPTFADISAPLTGKGWLRISDSNVEEVGIESALSENGAIFLAFYERIVEEEPTVEESSSSLGSSTSTASDSTIKSPLSRGTPDSPVASTGVGSSHTRVNGNARMGLVRGTESFSTSTSASSSRAGTPRIVRSVSAGIPNRPFTSATSSPSKLSEGFTKFASLSIDPEPTVPDVEPSPPQPSPPKPTVTLIDSSLDTSHYVEVDSPVGTSSARSPTHQSSKKGKHRKHKK